jgi:hypothetical protein
MEVAGMLRDGVPAVRMDLKGGMLGRMQDVPVDGVLGMSSLKETRFVLDQKQRRLEWWGRRSKGGVALPIAYGQAKLPLVMLRIHEREAACVLDTGMADGIGLPASFRPPGRQGQPATLHGLSGLVSAGEILVIPRVEAPPGAWLEVPDHFQETQKIGYIGLEIWSAAPVCFDFISNLAILEPGPGGGLPVQRGADHRLPLCWDRSGPVPRLRVLLVKPGGPLEEAKAGDEIVQVGPLKGKSLNRRNIQEWTAKRKAQVWTVLRDGRPLNIQVPPRSSSP